MAETPGGVGRRSFIAGVASAGAGAAAAAAPRRAAKAAEAAPKLPPPSSALIGADTRPPEAGVDRWHVSNAGSDYMVDCLKHLGYDYVTFTPGSTFRGFHESLINYGMNKKPELISVLHEEISGAMAHGYAKLAGKPMAIAVHNMVGLQHASMAIYNAYCDRVPMMVFAGNILDAATRRPGVEYVHTSIDVATIVRGYVKHDDSPASLEAFGFGTMKAHSMAMTPPHGPVLVVMDGDLQENPAAERPAMPPYHAVRPPIADIGALAEVATALVNAQTPLIVADRAARTPRGMQLLVELAETLEIPVLDLLNRTNVPNTHRLYSFDRSLVSKADVILGLEPGDLFGVVADVPDLPERKAVRRVRPDATVIAISSMYVQNDGNFQDQQRFYQPTMAIAGDAEASLPYLIEAVKKAMTSERRAQNMSRAAAWRVAFEARKAENLEWAARGWDVSPISVGRLCMELWDQIKNEPYSLVSPVASQSAGPQRLWVMEEYANYNGDAGAYGMGYGFPAAAGAALAARDMGRLAVNIQTDGDMLVAPSTLWTLAHHRIPLLTVMHNNRAWHQEVMHIQRMANRRRRGVDRAHMGTVLNDPIVDFAAVARGFGVYAEGPVSDPSALRPAIARAIKMVKSGHPAVLDVVVQPR